MGFSEDQREKVDRYIKMYGASHVDDEMLDMFVDDAASSLNPSFFGDNYEKAVAIYALHNLCLGKQLDASGGSEGLIESKTIGPVSVKFASFKGSMDSYGMTRYGILFQDILRSSGISMSVNNSWRLF